MIDFGDTLSCLGGLVGRVKLFAGKFVDYKETFSVSSILSFWLDLC